MLKPEIDRLDYGKQLIPPEHYELDVAIASTYSLDLNALLAVPIALCFGDTLDGDLKGEKIALFEAIGQLKDKLRVFYQKGNILLPATYNRLFTLLEPCLQPLIPDGGAFSSFHPKFWLIRYVLEKKTSANLPKVVYKLIVLSRNLTFDRSWDLAITLDGRIDNKKNNDKNINWNQFLKSLLNQAKNFTAGTKINNELGRIIWESPENFDQEISLFAGGASYGSPVNIEPVNNDSLMVVSPFIKSTGGEIKALDWLAQFAPSGKRYLFSSADELNMVGEDKLVQWECFSMNESIVKGEESYEINETSLGESAQIQNLHAKLIIHQKGRKSYWHLGSANATSAALGSSNCKPRNTEIMLRLEGNINKVGIDVIKDSWVTDNPTSSLFIKHKFTQQPQDSDDGNVRAILREIEHQLISAKWVLECSAKEEKNKFSLCLKVFERHEADANPLEKFSNGIVVTVGQLGLIGDASKKSYRHDMHWDEIDLTNISALIPVGLSVEKNGISLESFLIIEADLEIEYGDIRHQLILKSLVDTDEKIVNYLRLLLQIHPDKNEWLSFDKQNKFGTGYGSIFSGEPLFEQLLLASARHPKALERISNLMSQLKLSEVKVPKDFDDLWKVFEKEIIH